MDAVDPHANPLVAMSLAATGAEAPGALPALPPFERIAAAHFAPALDAAMARHREDIDAIGDDPGPPDADNTLAALDRAGEPLQRIEAVLHVLANSATTPDLQAVQRETAAARAAHWSAVQQHAPTLARLDALRARAEAGAVALDDEQRQLLARLTLDRERAGARLAPAAREEFGRLAQRHSELTTAFAENLLADEAAFTLPLSDPADRAGLPEGVLAAARSAADARGLDSPVITLSRSLLLPFLAHSPRCDLRQRLWQAWVGRGTQPGARDNRPLAAELLRLRRRQAALMGHANYADFKLADTMAGTRARVWALLDEVWRRALDALAGERALLREAMAAAGQGDAGLAAWDWHFWAERVRQQRFAIDEAALKAWFPLPAMVQAAFGCAERLFGLRFVPRPGLRAYHGDVDVYEVRGADGEVVGLFLHDNFARPEKRSGAWMSTLALQYRHGPGGHAVKPVVLNNNNFAKAPPGEPTLLSPTDVRTLFHEFGHGLHGLLSSVGYRRLACTQVLRDFVELPSQLFEHWGADRGVLRTHARHWRTGEPLPEAMLDRLDAARRFGQGYDTVRYTASAIVDLAAHEHGGEIADVEAFEAAVLAARGLPDDTGAIHRLPHFQHLFAGDAYAAGYYVYLWADVLEADAWEAFVEAGDIFDPTLAERLADTILRRGGSVDPAAAFRAFRGRDPEIGAMLRDRGLA